MPKNFSSFICISNKNLRQPSYKQWLKTVFSSYYFSCKCKWCKQHWLMKPILVYGTNNFASVYIVSNDIDMVHNECNKHGWPDTSVSLDADVHHADHCNVQHLKLLIKMRTTQYTYHTTKVQCVISYRHFQFQNSAFLTCVACSLPSTCTTCFSYSSNFHAIVSSVLSAFRTLKRSKILIRSLLPL